MIESNLPLTPKSASLPVEGEIPADVTPWQARKVAEGLKQANEGRFASPEAVRTVIRKFIPNG